MDVRVYYQKIREAESKIAEEFPIVQSRETADGGKPGVLTEVSRRVAAKLIIDGMAALASADDADTFRATQAQAKRAFDEAAAAAKLQVTVVPTAEFERMKAEQKAKE